MLKNIKKIISRNFVLLRINITFVVADSMSGQSVLKGWDWQTYPNILDSVSTKSYFLTWTHYRTLL